MTLSENLVFKVISRHIVVPAENVLVPRSSGSLVSGKSGHHRDVRSEQLNVGRLSLPNYIG